MKIFLIIILFLSSYSKGQLYLGIIQPIPKTIFGFQFDDSYASDSTVYRIMGEYGFRPDFVLSIVHFSFAKKAQYLSYQANGSTIIAHSVTHPIMSNTVLSYAQATYQMVQSKRTLDSLGFNITGWTTPSSILNAMYYPIVDSVFDYAFTEGNPNSALTVFTSTNKHRLSRCSLESNILDTITARIDTAIQQKQLIIFYAHDLPSHHYYEDGTSWLTEIKFRAVLSYIKTKSDAGLCRVLNTDNAILKYYQ